MLPLGHFFILLQKNQINERSPIDAERQLENKKGFKEEQRNSPVHHTAASKEDIHPIDDVVLHPGWNGFSILKTFRKSEAERCAELHLWIEFGLWQFIALHFNAALFNWSKVSLPVVWAFLEHLKHPSFK